MRIKIDNIAYGGYGVGRADGKAVFVDYAIPGDILDVDIYKDSKRFSFARISSIIKPSVDRITPECPNFSQCGGCSYLNIEYDTEIEYKKMIVSDQLKRIASVDYNYSLTTQFDKRFHYRSHSNIKLNNGHAGFFARNSNTMIDFPENGCLILAEQLIESVKMLNIKEFDGDLKIAIDRTGQFHHSLYNAIEIEEEEYSLIYRRNINGFFQGNRFLRKKMIETVSSYSELTKNDEFIDICAGCGFFTLPLSKIASHGTGFDVDYTAIEFAKLNAKVNRCDNIKFFQLSESEINPFKVKPKTVIVDPPRSGISKKGRRTINAINPEIIVYVSCNPSTFARDISDFFKNGYYLNEVTVIDMFPCTHHIELISKLSMIQR